MDYTLDFVDGRVAIATSGRGDVAGFERLAGAIVSDARFTPGMPILADHTELDARELTHEDARGIGALLVQFGQQFGDSPMAVVVPDALTYGLSRMIQSYGESAPVAVEIFYSRHEAESWLARAR